MRNTRNSSSTVARTRHLSRSRACPTSCPNALRFTLLSVTLPTGVRWPSPSAQLNREAPQWRAVLKMVFVSDFDIHSELAKRMRPVPLILRRARPAIGSRRDVERSDRQRRQRHVVGQTDQRLARFRLLESDEAHVPGISLGRVVPIKHHLLASMSRRLSRYVH